MPDWAYNELTIAGDSKTLSILKSKLKNEKRVKAEEDKQLEIISKKVLAKIDRELKFEKRRRGFM